MELKDLVGLQTLTGVENGNETYVKYGTCTGERAYIIFELSGVKYMAIEDPDDDYRSYLGEIEITDKEIKNTFPAVEVLCKMRPDERYQENDVLEMYDVATGKIVLEIGTGNINDYYPYCEMNYYPENMAINQI
jgi:hypothetical protein